MNVQSRPHLIKTGAVISHLEPVTVIESNPVQDCSQSQPEQRESQGCGNEVKSKNIPQFVEHIMNSVDEATPESAVVSLKELLLRHCGAFSESV